MTVGYNRQLSLVKYLERPLERCPYCGLKVKTARSLSLHIYQKHDELPRFCSRCGVKIEKSNSYQKSRKNICKNCTKKLVHDRTNAPKHWYREHKYRQNLRRRILYELGGKCVRCGENDWRCLQVDHINSDGVSERKKATKLGASSNLYIMKRIMEGAKTYQILCANCNWRKKYEKQEWNTTKRTRKNK